MYCNGNLVSYLALSVGRLFIHWEVANKMEADEQGQIQD